MIKRIVAYSMVFCLLIAIALAIAGVHQVELGAPFMAFMHNCSRELNDFKIEIPDIPNIPQVSGLQGFTLILNAFIKFGNFIINFLNIVADIFNVIISLIQFIVIVLKNLITFKDNLVRNSVSSMPVI